jgi:hypothetical protein
MPRTASTLPLRVRKDFRKPRVSMIMACPSVSFLNVTSV